MKSARASVLSYVGANVRRIRQKRGMTQEQLAAAIGVDIRTVVRIESGRTNLGVETLVHIAQVLEVRPGVLLRETTVPEVKRGRPKKSGP